ncbi:MAG TPA: ribose-phosphate pyrophosphokinase, partial [Chromatiales bacterium]|nr:ribose-phosphate pyrophosphokinase [Chromatiales bacterium]HEX23150.1 ribose-phosphate pyrophosphokinase [Chromatiales bacterium]
RSAGVVSGAAVVGEVDGRTAIIIDDMIAGGTTLARTITACATRGAGRILAAASHGLFVSEAKEKLAQPALEQLAITDSVTPFRLSTGFVADKLTVLDGSRQVAEAIRRLHEDGSLVALLED